VLGGFFSFAFGAAAWGEALVAGEEEVVVVAVLAAGFCEQPAATRARVLKAKKILFIDPPERNMILELSATG
jgi:hypothetical protein